MRRVLAVSAALAVTVVATSAAAKIDKKQKAELDGYVAQLAEATDPDAKHAMLLVQGATADAKGAKELLALEANEDARTRLGAKLAAVVNGDKQAPARVAAELEKQAADYGVLRWALAPLDDADELKVVAAYLKDAKTDKAAPMFRYLSDTRGKLFDELLAALANPNAERRELAARVILESGRSDVLGTLEKLVKAKDEAVRKEAVQMAVAFTRRPDTLADAKKILTVASKDAATSIRELAARRLVELGDDSGAAPLLDLARAAEKPETAAGILAFLVERGQKPGAAAVAQWLDSPDARAKRYAYELTAAAKEAKFVDKLLEMYASTEFDERLLAVQALGFTGDARAAAPLQSSLFEMRDDIRAAAVDSLVALRSPATLDALKKALTQEKNPEIKLRVIDAIGAVGGAPALQVLRFQVTNSDVEVKKRTVEAIRRIGLPDGARALDVLIRDRNVDVQWRAFLATLELDPAAAKAHFKAIFRNPPAGFMADLLEIDTKRRRSAFEYLLKEAGGSAQDQALRIVKQSGENDQVLYDIALSATADSRTRRDLVQFFGDRGTAKDLAVLETIARGKDPTLARTAAWMLTRHPSKGLEASYRGYLGSKDETLRAIALYGLATIWR